jgi:protein-S-isoprenylcysteine O-methyltransferase Ste14
MIKRSPKTMAKIKKFIISLSLPFIVTTIIPSLIIILIEKTPITRILNRNIFQIISGIGIIAIGFILVSWCIKIFFKLGKGTLMPISKLETQKLVIKGPYRYIRHPMILGVIIILLGESVLFGSWWLLGFCILFFILNLIYLPLVEERGLEKRFGDKYLQYKAKVHGWLPIKKYKP